MGAEYMAQILYGKFSDGKIKSFGAYNYLIGASAKIGTNAIFRYFNVISGIDGYLNFVKMGEPLKRRMTMSFQVKIGLEYIL